MQIGLGRLSLTFPNPPASSGGGGGGSAPASFFTAASGGGASYFRAPTGASMKSLTPRRVIIEAQMKLTTYGAASSSAALFGILGTGTKTVAHLYYVVDGTGTGATFRLYQDATGSSLASSVALVAVPALNTWFKIKVEVSSDDTGPKVYLDDALQAGMPSWSARTAGTNYPTSSEIWLGFEDFNSSAGVPNGTSWGFLDMKMLDGTGTVLGSKRLEGSAATVNAEPLQSGGSGWRVGTFT